MRKQLLRAVFTVITMLVSGVVWACDHCRPLVKSGVYNADFIETFLLLVLPLLALLALGFAAHYLDHFGHASDASAKKRRNLW